MAYTEMVMIIRKLYQDCRLVHGDLSEYNILFHEVWSGWMLATSRNVHLQALHLPDECSSSGFPFMQLPQMHVKSNLNTEWFTLQHQTCLHAVFPQDELWIIDVSQAVDLDHPRALDFLKEDAAHINTFFRRAGIAVLTTRQLFDFAVDPSINEANLHEAVHTLQQLAIR